MQDVLYLNWVVPLPLSKADLPPGVSVWERGQSTILTVLIYRHGHFGPVFLGPLRRLFPSPLQSNWRLYVTRVEGEDPTHSMVLFLRNFFSSALYAIGTRLGSDALPSELPCAFTFQTESELCANIIGASGELELQVAGSVGGRPALPHPFQAFAASWKEAVTALTLQESAIVQPPDLTCLAQAGISLPVDIAEVRPVVITHWKAGNWLTARGATGCLARRDQPARRARRRRRGWPTGCEPLRAIPRPAIPIHRSARRPMRRCSRRRDRGPMPGPSPCRRGA